MNEIFCAITFEKYSRSTHSHIIYYLQLYTTLSPFKFHNIHPRVDFASSLFFILFNLNLFQEIFFELSTKMRLILGFILIISVCIFWMAEAADIINAEVVVGRFSL